MNNDVFSKTVENLRNRVDARLVNNGNLKLTSKASYAAQKIFHNNLLVIQKIKTTIALNKAAYLRMCTLTLSKVLMYEFHYYFVKNKYGNKSRLLFTGIDSLVYKIETKNIYDGFSKNKEMLNFSSIILVSQNTTMIQMHQLLGKCEMKWAD